LGTVGSIVPLPTVSPFMESTNPGGTGVIEEISVGCFIEAEAESGIYGLLIKPTNFNTSQKYPNRNQDLSYDRLLSAPPLRLLG